MKKRIIIIAITIARFIITGSAQESQDTDTIRNQYKCFVSIKTSNGQQIEAALSSLTADSIHLAAVEEKYVRAGGKLIKVLNPDTAAAIAVSEIRSLRIKYDPNIIYRDELVKRKKELRQKNAGRIVGITLLTVVTVALIPVAVVTGTPDIISLPLDIATTNTAVHQVVSIPGNNLMLTKTYRNFIIKGDNYHYIKMVKRLTKSRTNPFENSIAKN